MGFNHHANHVENNKDDDEDVKGLACDYVKHETLAFVLKEKKKRITWS